MYVRCVPGCARALERQRTQRQLKKKGGGKRGADAVRNYWRSIGGVPGGGGDGGVRGGVASMVATLLDPLPFLVNGPSTAAAPNSDRTAWLRDQPGILHLVSGQEQEAALENIEALLLSLIHI